MWKGKLIGLMPSWQLSWYTKYFTKWFQVQWRWFHIMGMVLIGTHGMCPWKLEKTMKLKAMASHVMCPIHIGPSTSCKWSEISLSQIMGPTISSQPNHSPKWKTLPISFLVMFVTIPIHPLLLGFAMAIAHMYMKLQDPMVTIVANYQFTIGHSSKQHFQ